MFLKKLNVTSDSDRVYDELAEILKEHPWHFKGQIGLRHRKDATDPWNDAVGTLYNVTESEFTDWTIDSSYYVRQEIEKLQKTLNIEIGRARFMVLGPRQGLSVHKDNEVRYHLVLRTNENAFISHAVTDNNPNRSELLTTAVCYHLPKDNNWYQVDTREIHWVYNGGFMDRIHLVVCGV